MKWYSDHPARFARQLVADVLAVGWVVFWVWLALGVRDGVLELRAPGNGLVDAGTRMRDSFAGAADQARGVPVVGGAVSGALGEGSNAGTTLVDAGRSQIELVEQIGQWLAVALVVLPVLFLLLVWLPLRLRFARGAAAAARLRDAGALDVLALRALTELPLRQLTRISDDPAGAWRRGDPEVVAALAARTLARAGLRA
ncbi:hypothetical protein [Umezawaea beigongshangensis]|uniref:hypothetical protein n=1 Tax=Umezawaea beigongshangensis TaxID=2780383 RepID=UPI0018F24600|nr:hypothetical protein [Umezawaea beigongshangensis]